MKSAPAPLGYVLLEQPGQRIVAVEQAAHGVPRG